MNYNDLTQHHFATAAACGILAGPGVLRGAAGSRAQGTWVQFDVEIRSGNQADTVTAVRFLAFGCPHTIAVADWVATQGVGRDLSPALPTTIPRLQALFEVPAAKRGRLLIVEDAWIAAVSPPYRI